MLPPPPPPRSGGHGLSPPCCQQQDLGASSIAFGGWEGWEAPPLLPPPTTQRPGGGERVGALAPCTHGGCSCLGEKGGPQDPVGLTEGHRTALSGEEPGWGVRKRLHRGLQKVPALTRGCSCKTRLCAQTAFGCWEEEFLCFTTQGHRSGSKQDPEHPLVDPPRSSIPASLPATGSAQQMPVSNIPFPLPRPRAAPPLQSCCFQHRPAALTPSP